MLNLDMNGFHCSCTHKEYCDTNCQFYIYAMNRGQDPNLFKLDKKLLTPYGMVKELREYSKNPDRYSVYALASLMSKAADMIEEFILN